MTVAEVAPKLNLLGSAGSFTILTLNLHYRKLGLIISLDLANNETFKRLGIDRKGQADE